MIDSIGSQGFPQTDNTLAYVATNNPTYLLPLGPLVPFGMYLHEPRHLPFTDCLSTKAPLLSLRTENYHYWHASLYSFCFCAESMM